MGALAGRGVDREGAVQMLDAFGDAVESEMSLSLTRTRRGVEAAAVVPDGELNRAVLHLARNADRLRPAVEDGVGDEFAADAEDGVRRRVAELRAADVEADVQRGLSGDGRD